MLVLYGNSVLNVGLELFMEGPDVSNIYKYSTYVTFLPVEAPSHGDVYRYSSRHKQYNKNFRLHL